MGKAAKSEAARVAAHARRASFEDSGIGETASFCGSGGATHTPGGTRAQVAMGLEATERKAIRARERRSTSAASVHRSVNP